MEKILKFFGDNKIAAFSGTAGGIAVTIWTLIQLYIFLWPDKPDVRIYVTEKSTLNIPIDYAINYRVRRSEWYKKIGRERTMFSLRIINLGETSAKDFTLFLPGSGLVEVSEKGKELLLAETSGRQIVKEILPGIPVYVQYWPRLPVRYPETKYFSGRYQDLEASVLWGEVARSENKWILVFKQSEIPSYIATTTSTITIFLVVWLVLSIALRSAKSKTSKPANSNKTKRAPVKKKTAKRKKKK